MFERFVANQARQAVVGAEARAILAGSDVIRPIDLLLALTQDAAVGGALKSVGIAEADLAAAAAVAAQPSKLAGLSAEDAAALANLGIDVDEIAQRVGPTTKPPRKRPGLFRGHRPRFGEATKDCLEESLRLVQADGAHLITPAYMALAVLDVGGADLNSTVRRAGADPIEVRAALAKVAQATP